MEVNIQNLIDDARCCEALRDLRWSEKTCCPHCSSVKKARLGRGNRLRGARGRGTLKKEKPSVFGMIERNGDVVIHMLANVQERIKPYIETTVVPGTLVYTDEYNIYC